MPLNRETKPKYKVRFVARGYNRIKGLNHMENFSPTADITSISLLMQMAAQYNLIIHQMDVKTIHLHAPIDYKI